MLAKLLVELNQFISAPGETTVQFLDRFNKIVLGVTAIDVTQLPTELQLITILKNDVSVRFKMLYAMLGATANLTLVLHKEKMLKWEIKNEFGGNDKETVRYVANFTGSGFDRKRKKAFVKKMTQSRPSQLLFYFYNYLLQLPRRRAYEARLILSKSI